jgi:hypothetical protein
MVFAGNSTAQRYQRRLVNAATKPLRLPDFIAVGPVRTGTTWLDGIFRGHLGLPAGIKETQFFGWRYQLGIDWYARHFRDYAQAVVGEFAPTYFYDNDARERLLQHIPGCKIICTLREPVERLYSHYKLWRKLAIVKGTFAEALESYPSLAARLNYTEHLSAWLHRFRPENVLVLIYEDSRDDRQGYVDRICDFVGVSRLDLKRIGASDQRTVAHFERAPRYRRLARRARMLKDRMEVRGRFRMLRRIEPVLEACMSGGAVFPPLDAAVAARLRERSKPDILRLEQLLGRDLSIWVKP